MRRTKSQNEISQIKIRPICKTVRAVAPFLTGHSSDFKMKAYNAWCAVGGKTAQTHYPIRFFHWPAHHIELPPLPKSREDARLRFVNASSICFDTFPDYAHYEIIPMIWDCWPAQRDNIERWLRRHNVNCAIFTSTQTADFFRERMTEINILSVTEGADVEAYDEGKSLTERPIDLLEYGSIKRNFFHHYVEGVNHKNRQNGSSIMTTSSDLVLTLSRSKIVIALPRCDTEPEVAQGLETLTQRYWECMLSRCVLLGRAPKELIELIGYNPVIDLDREHADEQVIDIIRHISDYQELVNRNRKTALRMAPWSLRMQTIIDWLRLLGYKC